MAGLLSSQPLPSEGTLPGALFLNPALAPKTNGNVRPFAPGEYLKNPNGTWSSEISTTVSDPGLNGGAPTNIPTLWLINGKPVRVNEDMAAQLAAKSGLKFPAFKNMDEAVASSDQREKGWQQFNQKPEAASQVAPLWSAPQPQQPVQPVLTGGGGLFQPPPR